MSCAEESVENSRYYSSEGEFANIDQGNLFRTIKMMHCYALSVLLVEIFILICAVLHG